VVITKTSVEYAEYLEKHLIEGDKKIIRIVQDAIELSWSRPTMTQHYKRIARDGIALLAQRLRVTEEVADALCCFVLEEER
jgi:hypothetical protein